MQQDRLEFVGTPTLNSPAILVWGGALVVSVSAALQAQFFGGFVDVTSVDPTLRAALQGAGLILGFLASLKLVEALGRMRKPDAAVVADRDGLSVVGHAALEWSDFHMAEVGATKDQPHLAIILRDPDSYQTRRSLAGLLFSAFGTHGPKDRIVVEGKALHDDPANVAAHLNAYHQDQLRVRVAGGPRPAQEVLA